MRTWKIILIVVTLFNALLCHACCVVSGRAEDAAKKMREKLEKEETLISKIPDDDRQYSGLLTEDD